MTARLLAAEGVGSALLLATIVGSGIMAERLAGGNIALALLGNTLSTGCMLVVLILVFGPVSGAHLNPAVSLVFLLRRQLSGAMFIGFGVCQLVGAIFGVVLAHAMFQEPLFQISTTVRAGPSQWLAELVATFGLIVTILGTLTSRPSAVPFAVGLYVSAAYWFTASTSFANPTVAVARSLSDTFAGIQPASVPAFIIAEFVGALVGLAFCSWLISSKTGAASIAPTFGLQPPRK